MILAWVAPGGAICRETLTGSLGGPWWYNFHRNNNWKQHGLSGRNDTGFGVGTLRIEILIGNTPAAWK